MREGAVRYPLIFICIAKKCKKGFTSKDCLRENTLHKHCLSVKFCLNKLKAVYLLSNILCS